MRRLILGAAFAAFLGGAVLYMIRNRQANEVEPAQLAPVETALYLELRDMSATGRRWPETKLAQILSEPTVRRFTALPSRRIPQSWKVLVDTMSRLQASTAFLASTDLSENGWILGIRAGKDLQSWNNDLSARLPASFPYAIVPLRDLRQETSVSPLSAGRSPLFGIRKGNWLLLSPQTKVLAETFQRFESATGLESNEVFRDCRGHVPADADFVGYVAPPGIEALNHWWNFLPDHPGVSAVILSSKLDGERMRDNCFIRNGIKALPFAREGLKLARSNTVMYTALRLNLIEMRRAAQILAPQIGIAATMKTYFDEVTAAGVDFRELGQQVLGAELIVDQESEDNNLNGVFLLHIKDPQRFMQMTRKILDEKFPKQWVQGEIHGSPTFVFEPEETTNLVIGLYRDYMIAAVNRETYLSVLDRLKDGRNGLLDRPDYLHAVKQLRNSSDITFYLDAKTLFERGYNTVRPMLVFGTAFIPNLNHFIDPLALPETSEISRHLSPVVMSTRVEVSGELSESIGPITAYEASLLAIATATGIDAFERQ